MQIADILTAERIGIIYFFPPCKKNCHQFRLVPKSACNLEREDKYLPYCNAMLPKFYVFQLVNQNEQPSTYIIQIFDLIMKNKITYMLTVKDLFVLLIDSCLLLHHELCCSRVWVSMMMLCDLISITI